MSSNTVAVRQAGALAIANDQQEFTAAQLEAFGLQKASRGEQLVFLHTAQRTGLDPAAKQIYSIGRWDPETQREKHTIQTGIDGYRLIARRAADRAGETIGYGEVQWCGADGVWRDVWLESTAPAAARTTVYRAGQPFPAVALYREYVQTISAAKGGGPNRVWKNRPAGQLGKCAESLALRMAFPQELAGIYTDDEMGQAEQPQRARAERSAFAKPKPEPTVTAEVMTETGELIDPRGNQMKRLHATFHDAGMTDRDDCLAFVSHVIGKDITSTSELTVHQASRVIDALADIVEPEPMTGDEADGEERADHG
jgi:phage recombination protein Bet